MEDTYYHIYRESVVRKTGLKMQDFFSDEKRLRDKLMNEINERAKLGLHIIVYQFEEEDYSHRGGDYKFLLNSEIAYMLQETFKNVTMSSTHVMIKLAKFYYD